MSKPPDNAGPSHDASDFFEMSLDLLCVAGLDGYFKRLNPSWARTFGWTNEEMMSKPSAELVHPTDRANTIAGRTRLARGGELGPLVNRYLCKDGTYRWLEWRSVAHPESGLVYAAARDITEQKAAEERLAQAMELRESLERQLVFSDRMASVGTLAGGVAHEINNPLAAVAANTALIIDELGALRAETSSSRVDELLDMARDVQTGAERIRKIVRGLKTFARVDQERLAVCEVRPIVELSIDMTFNEIRHRARLVKDYGVTPLVEADESRLAQVFINLLVNATQALSEGDSGGNEIRIATTTDTEGRAVIEISDTGSGIPAALLERVFDPFFTTKPVGVGTGLGLSICHGLVTAMGGQIKVSSEEGRGTTFRVVLPAIQTRAEEAPACAPEAAKTRTRAAILVVDDDVTVGAVLRRVLREHHVTTVTSAKQALLMMQAGERFDVIISDVMMPEMSGMDFYDALLERFPSTAGCVVFISGGAFTPSASAFLARVPNEQIAKPFEVQYVRDLVRRMLEARPRSDEGS